MSNKLIFIKFKEGEWRDGSCLRALKVLPGPGFNSQHSHGTHGKIPMHVTKITIKINKTERGIKRNDSVSKVSKT